MNPDFSSKSDSKNPVDTKFMVKQVMTKKAMYLKCTEGGAMWREDPAMATQMPYEVAKTMATALVCRNRYAMPNEDILIFVHHFYEERVYG